MGHPEGKEREKNRSCMQNDNVWEFPQIDIKYKTTDPVISENSKQVKCQKQHLGVPFSNNRKSKIKKASQKMSDGKYKCLI